MLSLPEKSAITAGELGAVRRTRAASATMPNEDEHYDTISAFVKSCRGIDPDAPRLYWLAERCWPAGRTRASSRGAWSNSGQ